MIVLRSGLARLSALCLSVSLLGLAGCATFSSSSSAIYWPAPPQTPRFVYEATLQTADFFQASQRSALEAKLNDVLLSQPLLNKPFDVAANNGVIAITDTQSAQVHVYDMPRKRVFSFGWRGDGQLQKPLGVAMDATNQIYVADSDRGMVSVYTRFGHFLRDVGAPTMFDRLSDVAVSKDGSRIYALDRGGVESQRHQVTIFDADGRMLATFGGRGQADGRFNHPSQLALMSNGDVLVMDAGNFRVQRFSASGEFKYVWGKPGAAIGQLARPRGLAVDSYDHVYVSDAAFQNVQVFTAAGQLLLTIDAKHQYGPGHYVLPAGMNVDETNRLYVVDQFLGKVEVLRLLDDDERKRLAN